MTNLGAMGTFAAFVRAHRRARRNRARLYTSSIRFRRLWGQCGSAPTPRCGRSCARSRPRWPGRRNPFQPHRTSSLARPSSRAGERRHPVHRLKDGDGTAIVPLLREVTMMPMDEAITSIDESSTRISRRRLHHGPSEYRNATRRCEIDSLIDEFSGGKRELSEDLETR